MIKHGKAQEISMAISLNENTVCCEISDDGLPFDFKKNIQSSLGMGLKNISSRIKHIEAKLVQVPEQKGNKFQIILKSVKNVKNSNN